MGLGRVWYGAKYSHGVWEQFAHHFENFKKSEKIREFQEILGGRHEGYLGAVVLGILSHDGPCASHSGNGSGPIFLGK